MSAHNRSRSHETVLSSRVPGMTTIVHKNVRQNTNPQSGVPALTDLSFSSDGSSIQMDVRPVPVKAKAATAATAMVKQGKSSSPSTRSIVPAVQSIISQPTSGKSGRGAPGLDIGPLATQNPIGLVVAGQEIQLDSSITQRPRGPPVAFGEELKAANERTEEAERKSAHYEAEARRVLQEARQYASNAASAARSQAETHVANAQGTALTAMVEAEAVTQSVKQQAAVVAEQAAASMQSEAQAARIHAHRTESMAEARIQHVESAAEEAMNRTTAAIQQQANDELQARTNAISTQVTQQAEQVLQARTAELQQHAEAVAHHAESTVQQRTAEAENLVQERFVEAEQVINKEQTAARSASAAASAAESREQARSDGFYQTLTIYNRELHKARSEAESLKKMLEKQNAMIATLQKQQRAKAASFDSALAQTPADQGAPVLGAPITASTRTEFFELNGTDDAMTPIETEKESPSIHDQELND